MLINAENKPPITGGFFIIKKMPIIVGFFVPYFCRKQTVVLSDRTKWGCCMQKFKIISSMLIALCAGAVMDAMAYDYSFSGEEWRDGDYVYLIDSRDVYFCGSDFSSFLPPEHQAKQMHIINAGGTVYNTATARLYYCCGDSGYWVYYQGYTDLPQTLCLDEYGYKPLGGNKYCYGQRSYTINRCKDMSGHECMSGAVSYDNCEGYCEYGTPQCTSFTHCGTGYYKNGTVCTKCPELDGVSGTTAGYTNNGIASCYLPNGSVGSNEMGEWLIDGGNCPY